MKTLIILLITIFGGLIIAGLQRYFSPETLVDGFMDKDKAEDLCPSCFQSDKE